MTAITQFIQLVAILAAAGLLGNWFLSELRHVRRSGKPWYAVYLTLPGILVMGVVVGLPLAAWYLGTGS